MDTNELIDSSEEEDNAIGASESLHHPVDDASTEARSNGIISTRHLYVPIKDLIMIVVFVVSIMSAWGFYSNRIDEVSQRVDVLQAAQKKLSTQQLALTSQLKHDEIVLAQLKTIVAIKDHTLSILNQND